MELTGRSGRRCSRRGDWAGLAFRRDWRAAGVWRPKGPPVLPARPSGPGRTDHDICRPNGPTIPLAAPRGSWNGWPVGPDGVVVEATRACDPGWENGWPFGPDDGPFGPKNHDPHEYRTVRSQQPPCNHSFPQATVSGTPQAPVWAFTPSVVCGADGPLGEAVFPGGRLGPGWRFDGTGGQWASGGQSLGSASGAGSSGAGGEDRCQRLAEACRC